MKLYRRIILLTLTLLVLVSSTGMAVGMHICGGKLRDVTFFGAEANCPMAQKQQQKLPPCHSPKEKKADSNTCCEDHQLQIKELGDAFSHKITTLSKLEQLKLFAVVKAVVLQFYTSHNTEAPRYALYESPPLAQDIPVLVQSFLL
ncbi:HYC_CC_PP family protein [Pontibacter sp. MBLB2868]|uniref:HYC_CC_PP family protein n=1 Tax=Pontibacter sp. MBLB2868 TaxID=3451555 RepID=UPI003F7541B3